MKKLVTAVVLLTSLGVMSTASAARTERTTVTSVFANASGAAFVILGGILDSAGNLCSSNGRYRVNPDSAGSRGLLAAALTAQASDSEVQLDVGTCEIDGQINNVIVY